MCLAVVAGCGDAIHDPRAAPAGPLGPPPLANPLRSGESGKPAAPTNAANGANAPKPESNGAAQPPIAERAPIAERPPGAEKPKPKFDPIAVNGQYFVGWQKPKLAIVVTGHQDGYIEPCGCSGLENQKGGLSRRYSLLRELSERGWPLAKVDVGSMVRRFGKQAELQFSACAEAMRQMQYAAVGFGASDLRLSSGEVAAAVAGDQPDRTIFVSANVDLFGLAPKFRLVEAGGLKLGITSVLGDEYRRQVNNAELQIAPAAEGLKSVVGELAGADVKILLANATLAETRELARQFPQFDIVVSGGGAEEPPAEAGRVEGSKALLIELGHKAMFAVVLGLYDDPQQPVRYQRVALDSRFPDSPEMKALMTNYQSQLQALGWDGLGLRPSPHPTSRRDNPLAGKFVGGQSCKECHEAAWDVYINSPHARATQTLVDLKPARHFDPECVSCHVTGWNPQEYFPYVSGYLGLDRTPELAGQSCENCHGPGAAHIDAERGSDKTLQAEWRKAMHQDKANADESCRVCHDLDNSINFDFKTYWPQIEH